jgi:hypothetical protein
MPTNQKQTPLADLRSSEVALLRIGLVGAGALLLWMAVQVVTSAPLADTPAYVFAVIALGGLGFAALVAAGWRTPSRQWKWLILLAVICEIALTAIIWRQTQRLHPTSRVDIALYIDMASELVQRGENPYAWNFNSVPEIYRAAQAAGTPQIDGSIAERYCYPALGILMVLPLEAVDLPGVWLVPVLAHMATACLLFLAAPRSVQPVILFPMVTWFGFSALTAAGADDMVWSGLLVGMIVAWRRPTLRAVLYGLAVSYKQSPWLLLPFLVIRLWCGDGQNVPRRVRMARVVRFVLISGLTFLLVNLPFILWDPAAWIKGVFTPMASSLVYLSQGGLSGLTAFGYLNLPKSYYLLATLVVLALSLFIYWRHYSTLRDTFVVLPAILLWFSHRALVSYWAYWAPPALAILIQRPPPALAPAKRTRGVHTALVAAGGVIALVTAGVVMEGEPRLAVELQPPFLTLDGNVYRLAIRVENNSDETIAPRFGIHYNYTGFSPSPWHIESGPLVLEPNQWAVYQVVSDGQLTFPAHTSAQVVVTDAGGDESLRAVSTIGPDHSFLWPDAIANPQFLYWDSGATTPIFWAPRVLPAGAGSITYANQDGHSAVRLRLDGQHPGPKSVALNSFILVPPTPFGIWVYADGVSDGAAQYGIEFTDDARSLILRFGTRQHVEHISDRRVVVERPAMPGTWTYQEIDLPGLYRQAGWDLPPLKPVVYRQVDADFRAVNMSLFLSSDGTADGAQVCFGPLQQDGFEVKPETLMAETLSDPVGYYLRLSERYTSERNYARALVVLERALAIVPGDAAISGRIDEIKALLSTVKSR